MKGSFQIKAKDKNVITERGVRVFIMERLLNSPFKRGTVFNADEKTVEVQLEGDEKQIMEFRKSIEKALLEKCGNPELSFVPFRANPELELPAIMRSSQALVVGQLDKGITVQLEILKSLERQREDLLKALGSLQAEVGKLVKG